MELYAQTVNMFFDVLVKLAEKISGTSINLTYPNFVDGTLVDHKEFERNFQDILEVLK